jgi:hypothetical protein
MELSYYFRYILSVYFFTVYFIFFVNNFYGVFSKLDKFIDKISGAVDNFVESEKEISPVDDFFIIVGYYIVVYS